MRFDFLVTTYENLSHRDYIKDVLKIPIAFQFIFSQHGNNAYKFKYQVYYRGENIQQYLLSKFYQQTIDILIKLTNNI